METFAKFLQVAPFPLLWLNGPILELLHRFLANKLLFKGGVTRKLHFGVSLVLSNKHVENSHKSHEKKKNRQILTI